MLFTALSGILSGQGRTRFLSAASIAGCLTAALDTRALLFIRLAANVVWIMLLGVAFVAQPTLAVYVYLTPLQMAFVLIPLLMRWHRTSCKL